LAVTAGGATGQERRLAPAPIPASAADPSGLTYADLADLADAATLVARAEVRSAVRLEPPQAPGIRPGMARFFVQARTRALLVGGGLGESISYLADLPLDPNGRTPSLRKRAVLVFARPVAGRPGEIRLVAPDAQLRWSQPLEGRVRGILAELIAPGAAPRIRGVREAMHVRGNLVGEGETQVFLATAGGDPVSLTVLRRPGALPTWGVAFGEIVDQAARPPLPDSLSWYRLACFLPDQLPAQAILGASDDDRRQAEADYRFVRLQLGVCPRSRPREWHPGLAPPGRGA
jgi:hypothetical protein